MNGDYVNWEDAQVHILSHSHQRGSLIFGFIPIFENEGVVSLFRLNDHVERLFTSCATAGIPLDYSPDDIQLAIKDTMLFLKTLFQLSLLQLMSLKRILYRKIHNLFMYQKN